VNSILERNYPVTQMTILLVAGIFVFMNLLVDIAYTAIDPRIRYGGEQS
jgi:peptide/nickel transport system permease protein